MQDDDVVEEFLELIEEYRNNDKFKFADAILLGIHETVSKTQVVTLNQRRAVKNIGDSVNKAADAGWKRRYEGYSK